MRLILAAVIAASSALSAQSNPQPRPTSPNSPTYPTPAAQAARTRAPGEDWVQLFNGKDLTGWVNVGKEKWEIEDGTLHGIAVTREYGYLQTE